MRRFARILMVFCLPIALLCGLRPAETLAESEGSGRSLERGNRVFRLVEYFKYGFELRNV